LKFFSRNSYLTASFKINNLIILFFLICIATIFFIKIDDFDAEDRFFYWAFMLAIPVEIMGMCNDVVARAVEYYDIFLIIIIPNIVRNYGASTGNYRSLRAVRYIIKWTIVLLMLWLMIHYLTDSKLVPYEIYG
jgi:hypothetical protein